MHLPCQLQRCTSITYSFYKFRGWPQPDAPLSIYPLSHTHSVSKFRMKKASYVALCAVVVVAMLLFEAPLMAKAVTCSPLELSSCISAITSSAPPSSTCCTKLREQRPCLCGYLKDPNLRQYVNSPGARKVASTCGVPFPSC